MVTYIGYSTIDKNTINTVLTDKDLALRDLMNHFYTRRGERVMNPEFGSILHELVFDPLDARTEMLVGNDVEKIINIVPGGFFED